MGADSNFPIFVLTAADEDRPREAAPTSEPDSPDAVEQPSHTPTQPSVASKNVHDLSVAIYDPEDLDLATQDSNDDVNPHTTRPHEAVAHAADTVTTHWLLHGRIPALPPRRHRNKPSLTLPLTVDLASPVRSLTHSSAAAAVNDDASMMTHMPSSPPPLTESKSSKSSSLPSSEADGSSTAVQEADLAHFEDIGLDDEEPADGGREYNHAAYAKNSAVRVSERRRVSVPASAPGRNHAPNMAGGMRELLNHSAVRSPPLGSASSQPRTAPMRPHAPVARSSFGPVPRTASPRPFSNYSNPSTPPLPPGPRRPSSRASTRSPSPAHQLPGQMQGPVSVPASLPSSANGSPAFFGSSSRRGSTALQRRKTARELEQEYAAMDEADDGALPDDTNLWNVPMSPLLYRQASEAASSTNTSANTSPERPSPRGTPRPSRLRPDTALRESGPRTAPAPLRPRLLQRDRAPPVTVQTPDRFAFGHPNRAKSWDNVLSELSEEAKHLSVALDQHETQSAQRHESLPPEAKEAPTPQEARRQSTGASTSSKPSRPTLPRARTVELPPLRKNHVMIDPLPISKEKEKVLSRTRPSWLPPKDRKEEKKHLREYQRMMERSLEAEKKRAAAQAAEDSFRTGTAETLQRIWDVHVFPRWEAALGDTRTRELWWRGIPHDARAEAWTRGIGNELGLTATTYVKARSRAQAAASARDAASRTTAWFTAIDDDVAHAFPGLRLFQAGQPLHAPLQNILRAYAMYRSDVGYRSGTHLPAALLLLVLGAEENAFTALANLLNRPIPLAFLTHDKTGMARAHTLIAELVKAQLPRLATHLFNTLSLSPAELLQPMLSSMFLYGCSDAASSSSSSNNTPLSSPTSTHSTTHPHPTSTIADRGLSLPLALRIWDVLIFDGDAAMVRGAAGLLSAQEARLYGSRDDVLAVLGLHGALRLGGGTPLPEAAGGDDNANGSSIDGAKAQLLLTALQSEQWSEVVEGVMRSVREVGRRRVPRGEATKSVTQAGTKETTEKEKQKEKKATAKDGAVGRRNMRLDVPSTTALVEKGLEGVMSPTTLSAPAGGGY